MTSYGQSRGKKLFTATHLSWLDLTVRAFSRTFSDINSSEKSTPANRFRGKAFYTDRMVTSRPYKDTPYSRASSTHL
ncbi:hypothetical protein BgiBS90_029819 [Biomphalaria glabrata]|nr:hypothetical protein BgiBS90_029819 [Biomphalaria glabrata]